MPKKRPKNKQKVEQITSSSRGWVDVIKIWYTIQGEGPYQGKPAIFIRLAGCTLQCPFCDTNYTEGRHPLPPNKVVSQCQQLMTYCLVVISGGEPFRQDITMLVNQLLMVGYKVQIETNGTVFLPGFPYEKVTIVCSPKSAKIDPFYLTESNYFKYILDAEHVDPEDGLPSASLGMKQKPARPLQISRMPIYVQPMDEGDLEKDTLNLEAAVRSVMTFDYSLCIQLHKILGME